MNTAIAYCPVRTCSDDGHEWLDTGNICLLQEMARQNAKDVDLKIPQWAAQNPCIRIAKVQITEIRE